MRYASVASQDTTHAASGRKTALAGLEVTHPDPAAAVALDVVATGCMVAGSSKSWFTAHGVVGYTALLVMVVVVARLWALSRKGPDTEIPAKVYGFLRGAYVLWLIAYGVGVALAASR